MIDVLLVDDQEMVRTGFGMILQAEPDISVVGEAGDGAAAVSDTRRLRPDVVLMDIRMPTMDGIEATRLIMDDPDNSSRVLMLTTFDLDEYVYDAIRAGAAGFLLKDAPPVELINAIRIIADGDALLAPSVTRRLIEEFANQPSPASLAMDQLESLTERELDVLRVIAKGMTNSEIAEALFVSETTIKTHVSHILNKLALRDRVQAVVLAYECGLVERGSSRIEP